MKINSIAWFIKRPQYIPQGLSIFFRRFYSKKENTRDFSEDWCRNNSVDTKEALHILYPSNHFTSFKEDQKDIYLTAAFKEKECKVEMGGPGDLDLLYNLTLNMKPKKVLETGVAYGWSSLSVLCALKINKKGELISTDMPYMHKNNEAYVGCVIPAELKSRWRLIREADITGLSKALKVFKKEIDLCHYDSDKSYLGRIWAYPRIWSKLKSKGVFVSDDIQDNIAFKEFSEKLGIKPIIIYSQNKYVGILVKP